MGYDRWFGLLLSAHSYSHQIDLAIQEGDREKARELEELLRETLDNIRKEEEAFAEEQRQEEEEKRRREQEDDFFAVFY